MFDDLYQERKEAYIPCGYSNLLKSTSPKLAPVCHTAGTYWYLPLAFALRSALVLFVRPGPFLSIAATGRYVLCWEPQYEQRPSTKQTARESVENIVACMLPLHVCSPG